jgi:hypothetical protein
MTLSTGMVTRRGPALFNRGRPRCLCRTCSEYRRLFKLDQALAARPLGGSARHALYHAAIIHMA